MAYFQVIFSFTCPNGHPNAITEYYKAKTRQEAEKRFPDRPVCVSCPIDAIVSPGPFNFGFISSELSELEFMESGGTLEPGIC
jgi:hypothetical protein